MAWRRKVFSHNGRITHHSAIMTSKRRRDVVLTSWWRYYCALCPLDWEYYGFTARRFDISLKRAPVITQVTWPGMPPWLQRYFWGYAWAKKRVLRAGITNNISYNTTGYDYLSMLRIRVLALVCYDPARFCNPAPYIIFTRHLRIWFGVDAVCMNLRQHLYIHTHTHIYIYMIYHYIPS